jgi:16S rRNA C1402 (ribose-2'-O) methylase RsmI
MIARELTKIHESFIEGTATEVAEYFAQHPTEVRGEFVVLVTV